MAIATDTRDLPAIRQRELTALVDDLNALGPKQWRSSTLCADRDVEEVLAHFGAAATITRWGWIRSIVGARFDADVHNRRRLEEFRGATPQETLERFFSRRRDLSGGYVVPGGGSAS